LGRARSRLRPSEPQVVWKSLSLLVCLVCGNAFLRRRKVAALTFPLPALAVTPDGHEEIREDFPLDRPYATGEQLEVEGERWVVVSVRFTRPASPEQTWGMTLEPCPPRRGKGDAPTREAKRDRARRRCHAFQICRPTQANTNHRSRNMAG